MLVMESPRRLALPFYSMSVAKDLLKIGAVKLNVNDPFKWVSGIRSPIYCDNRIINSKVEVRDRIVGIFVEYIRNNFPQAQIIAGVATGGMVMGTLIADRLKLPFIYVREAPKEHGLMKQVEGHYDVGNKVILIEDHISTGKSSLNAIEGLKKMGLELISLISIMSYGFEVANRAFDEKGVEFRSLCDLDAILEAALEEGRISEKEKEEILGFRNSPKDWFEERNK